MLLLLGIVGAVLVGSAVVSVIGEEESAPDDDHELMPQREAKAGDLSAPSHEDLLAIASDDLDQGFTRQGTEMPDILTGSVGDDRLNGSDGSDVISGNDGDDTLVGEGGDDRLSGGAGSDTLSGGAGDDLLQGGTGSDLLRGHSGDDALEGGAGADRLIGGEGDDVLTGGAGDDGLEGGLGNDRLAGGGGSDNLNGGAGDDRIDGSDDGAGKDWLMGGEGGDTLIFGTADIGSGGNGSDLFVLAGEHGDYPVSEIVDFDPDEDSLVLLWNDASSDAEPVVTLTTLQQGVTEIRADGAPVAILRGAAPPSPADVHLIPMSQSHAL